MRCKLSGDLPALRVPYDVIAMDGPAHVDDDCILFVRDGQPQRVRAKAYDLGTAHPGERVLIGQLPDFEAGWWLCEVEAVDGDDWS